MTTQEKEQPTPSEDLETLRPSPEHKVYVLGRDEAAVTLVQRPLSFFGKLDLFAALGGALDNALSSGVSLRDLLEEHMTPSADQDAADAELFAQLFLKVISEAPELMLDVYTIALGVPRGRRDYVKTLLELNEEDGGLSDDQGMEILDTFIEQNGEVLMRFFEERISPLLEKIKKVLGRGSESSKPSRAIRRATQKR